MPPDIAAAIKRIGPVIDPAGTAALFALLQKEEPYAGVTIARDEKYGADPRNRLDVFRPAKAEATARPILIFVHGGAFTGGDKHPPGNPFYDNIMLWAVANGMVGVNITYRLAPEHPYPAGAEDVAMAVQWTLENANRFGGDPRRIFLMGHSAGATHVATYVAHPEFNKVKGGGLAGAILVSGLYELTPDTDGPPQRAYFGGDMAKWPERSSLSGTRRKHAAVARCARRTRPSAVRRAGRCPLLGDVLGSQRLPDPYRAPGPEPHVGGLLDQHGRDSPHRRDQQSG